MSRFGEEQDPLFRRINSSISFDWRLASFDVEQSKAHARALAKLEVLDGAELDHRGPGEGGRRARPGQLRVP
jgi:argininosuccinate lyase